MKVKELLSDPAKWTKMHYAKDKLGRGVESTSPLADRFCLYGAINRCYAMQDERTKAIEKLKIVLFNERNDGSLIAFNDNDKTTHEDLMRVLERADV